MTHPPAQDSAEPLSSPRVVVIAASAGGLQPMLTLLGSLPADLPAAVIVVQHRGLELPELLPALLAARTPLRVRHLSTTGDLLEPATVYVCPPGVHLTTEYALRIVESPDLDVHPSADLALRSAARTHGAGVVAVILSGTGRGGAAGCEAVLAEGGTVLVQDPASCTHTGMPKAAIRSGAVTEIVPVDGLAEALVRCLAEPSAQAPRRAAIRVLLVDDHRILLDGLRILLGAEVDIDVVADAEDGTEAVRLARTLSPDVVVMDIAMPHLDGIEATRRIRTLNPKTNVVALSACADHDIAREILNAGATGYLDKNAAFAELASAIRTVAAGKTYLSPWIGTAP